MVESYIEGYNQLSEGAKRHFKKMYKTHMECVEVKNHWIPIGIEEDTNFVKVIFKNGSWIHYYSDGTWS